MEEKRIEVIELSVSEIKTDFGNPRKISKENKEKLRKSIEQFGDFGIFIIDENNNVIAGNQRLSIIREMDENAIVTCKKLIGYTEAEKKYINIKDNQHAGEWDLDLLNSWYADINIELGNDELLDINPEERKIDDMELIHYEKYDYVLIVCKYELDYNDLVRKLGIEGKKVKIHKKRKIKARAVWYENIKDQIIEKPVEEE